MQLRNYQIETVNQTRSAFERGHRAVILCSPTGSGKTVEFSYIAKSCVDRGLTAMVMCDRKELIRQAYDKMNTYYNLHPTIIAPGHVQAPNNIYIASVDTLKRRDLPEADLLIVDEAHKATFDKIVAHYKSNGRTWIIGATATPVRRGRQTSLHTMYDELIEPVKVSGLISEGYLAPAITYGPEMDLSSLGTDSNDYNEKELFTFFDRQRLYDGIIENYRKFAHPGPTLIFNVNRKHSRLTCERFQAAGIDARHVDGSFSDKDRYKAISGFESGEFPVLSNCSILTTGYDNENIRNIIVNRATLSMSLWLQMLGRGSRPSEGKAQFTVIDMGGNAKKHGLYEMDRDWDLVKKRGGKQGVAPVKICGNCGAMVHLSKPVCPHCGCLFPIKEKKLAKSEFMQITEKAVPAHLRKPFTEMVYGELVEYGRIKGYKPGWAWIMKDKVKKERRKVTK